MDLVDFDADGDRRPSQAELLEILDVWIAGRLLGALAHRAIDAGIGLTRPEAPR